MNTSEIIFKNRKEAGQKLAELLKSYSAENPIILAMPRGGVVVAYEIAKALNAPLDVIVSRKIGMPTQPEYAIGAIAPGDIQVLDARVNSYVLGGIAKGAIQDVIDREKKEMERRIKLYRGDKPPLDLKDKVVIIVDDGVATGQTALVAIRSVRKMQPKKIIFACGVGAYDSMKLLRQEADEVISLNVPKTFYAVGQWYQDFGQVTDEEVLRLLIE